MSNTSGPTDSLGNPIDYADIVLYTQSARSSSIKVGVATKYETGLGISQYHSYSQKIGNTTIFPSSGTSFDRVTVITPFYERMPNANPKIVDIRKEALLSGNSWPAQKQVQSIMSPVTKWLRSFEKKFADFHKTTTMRHSSRNIDADGYYIDRNGKKSIFGHFTTSHDGETLTTSVEITTNKVSIYIRKGSWMRVAEYPSSSVVFGIPWFTDPDVENAVEKAIAKVKNQ